MTNRREDWKFIKKAKLIDYSIVKDMMQTPLIVFDTNISILKRCKELYRESIKHSHNNGTSGEYLFKLAKDHFLFNEFCFLDRTISEDDKKTLGTNEGFQYVNFISTDKGEALELTLVSENSPVLQHFRVYERYSDKKTYTEIGLSGMNSEQLLKNITPEIETKVTNSGFQDIFYLISFFKALSESDLYPVERINATPKKMKAHVAMKKPWLREDLVSIVFLNKLPVSTQPSESKGGHHASPRFHQKRGHMRSLTNKVYKNHPKYGQQIYIKPCWVGERTTIVNGTTYKVL